MAEPFPKLQSYLDDIERSPHANHCMTCGHVKHNDLGYCQVGTCSCEFGWTYRAAAEIIRRDLPSWLAAALSEAAGKP